ncbi:GIY-YIG nuclease family protein [Methylocapsa aurea]|uniref:GIY-YIG nuclease family protein n=1 Tax=Methylocapsa aurea TaxID=663610 RepID=UPI003D1895A5
MKGTNAWRARSDQPRTVYIKSSIAAAKIQIADFLEAAQQVGAENRSSSGQVGVLYVLRCLAMKDEVYKVGWTSSSAEQRARELSSATGVPVAFAVANAWHHSDPEALEKGVHAMLSPYRLNESREFFKLNYPALKAIIEAEITRSNLH